MIKRDCLWLWGQDAGTHHEMSPLPGENKMGPVEGAEFLGIPNMCRVVMGNKPEPPFDKEMDKLTDCRKVVWSIIGDTGSERTDDGISELDEVLKLAEKYDNLTGGVMDDFFSEKRKAIYTPEVVRGFADRLHKAKLDLWCVLYEHQVDTDVQAWIDECDVISFWTWCSENLNKLGENIAKVEKMAGKGQKIYAGCYMWDYGNGRPMPLELMKMQLETFEKWLEEGRIEGVIICSNCIADIGLEAVDFTKKWLDENVEE